MTELTIILGLHGHRTLDRWSGEVYRSEGERHDYIASRLRSEYASDHSMPGSGKYKRSGSRGYASIGYKPIGRGLR